MEFPELLPGLAQHRRLANVFALRSFSSLYERQSGRYIDSDASLPIIHEDPFVGLGLPVSVLFLCVPVFLYRFSLKSTSYLYLLLLGVIGVLYGKYRVFGDAPADERLGHASRDGASLAFGVITFGSVLVLPIVVIALARMAGDRLPAMPERFAFVVGFFTMHPTFGWSNVMQLSNAALAVLTLPVAWLAVKRPRFTKAGDNGVRLMVFARGVLTVGLILWFLAVLWYQVGWDGLTEFVGAVFETIRGVRFDPSLPGPVPSEPVA